MQAAISAALLVACAANPCRAQGAASTPRTPADMLGHAQLLIKEGENAPAAELLKEVIAASNRDAATLRQAYLMLVKTYEYWASAEAEERGPVAAEAFTSKAQQVAEECLRHDILRHTRPDSTYPEAVIRDFEIVRSKIFGKFFVTSLDPPDAVVTLGANVVLAPPGAGLPSDEDIPVGRWLVTVQRQGYRDRAETIDIGPNERIEREYALKTHRAGLFLGTGVSGGSAFSDDSHGFTGAVNLRIGGALRRDLTLGIEFTGTYMTVFTLCATYFPGDRRGYLRGGVGVGNAEQAIVWEQAELRTAPFSIDETGLSLLAAAGYEWRLTEKFALGPRLQLDYLDTGAATGSGGYVSLGVDCNWYW